MRIDIDHARAKKMARVLETAVQETTKDRFRYNQALDAVARMLGLNDANALAAAVGDDLPDLSSDDAETLDRRIADQAPEIRAQAEDWLFAVQADAGPARADAAARALDRACARVAACAREAETRLRRRRSPQIRESLERCLRRARMAIAQAPAPWRARFGPEKTAPTAEQILPSARRRGFRRAADLLTPVLPESFSTEIDDETPRLRLFHDDGHEPRIFMVDVRRQASGTSFHAALDSVSEGVRGQRAHEEREWQDLGRHDTLWRAVEAVLLEAGEEPLFPDGRESEARADLTAALNGIFQGDGPAAGADPNAPLDPVDSPAAAGRSAHESAPTGEGDQLWWVYPHRVLRDDTALLVRAPDRETAEKEGLLHAEACCDALAWEVYDADYWLEYGYHSERACAQCGEPTDDPDVQFCSAGCAQSHAKRGRTDDRG